VTRVGYDSTNVADMPHGGDVYFPYIDGNYANVAEVRKAHPHAEIVSITVLGHTLDADMVDVEPGCVWPASKGAEWVAKKVKRDGHAKAYCYASELPALKAAVKATGVNMRQVSFCIARYGHDKTIPPGVDAVQWLSPDGPPDCRPPGHYDEWVIRDGWPTRPKPVIPKPKTPPPAKHTPAKPVRRPWWRRFSWGQKK
jgi:hypothetical protein